MIGGNFNYSHSGDSFGPQPDNQVQKKDDQSVSGQQPARQPETSNSSTVGADPGQSTPLNENVAKGGGQVPIKNGHVAVVSPGQEGIPQDPVAVAKMKQIQDLMAKKQARAAARAALHDRAAQLQSLEAQQTQEIAAKEQQSVTATSVIDTEQKTVDTEQKAVDTEHKAVDTKQTIKDAEQQAAVAEQSVADTSTGTINVTAKVQTVLSQETLKKIADVGVAAYRKGQIFVVDANNYKQYQNDLIATRFDKARNHWDFHFVDSNKEHAQLANDPTKLAAFHKLFVHPHNPGAPVSHSAPIFVNKKDFDALVMARLMRAFPGRIAREDDDEKEKKVENEPAKIHLHHHEVEKEDKREEASKLKEAIVEDSKWKREEQRTALEEIRRENKKFNEKMDLEDREYHENVSAKKREEIREVQDPTKIKETPSEHTLHPLDPTGG